MLKNPKPRLDLAKSGVWAVCTCICREIERLKIRSPSSTSNQEHCTFGTTCTEIEKNVCIVQEREKNDENRPRKKTKFVDTWTVCLPKLYAWTHQWVHLGSKWKLDFFANCHGGNYWQLANGKNLPSEEFFTWQALATFSVAPRSLSDVISHFHA